MFFFVGSDLNNALAVSDANSSKISILDGKSGTNEAFHTIESLHSKQITLMAYSAQVDVAISIDEIGMIEYWSGAKNQFKFPKKSLFWEYKTDTDLYALLKAKVMPICLKISPDGKIFAIVTNDRCIYIFDLKTATILKRLDETFQKYVELGKLTM